MLVSHESYSFGYNTTISQLLTIPPYVIASTSTSHLDMPATNSCSL